MNWLQPGSSVGIRRHAIRTQQQELQPGSRSTRHRYRLPPPPTATTTATPLCFTLRTSPSLRVVCACALFCSCCTNFCTLALLPLFFSPKVLSSTSLSLAFCWAGRQVGKGREGCWRQQRRLAQRRTARQRWRLRTYMPLLLRAAGRLQRHQLLGGNPRCLLGEPTPCRSARGLACCLRDLQSAACAYLVGGPASGLLWSHPAHTSHVSEASKPQQLARRQR